MVVAAQSMGGDALALATAFGHALWVDDQDFSQRDVQLRVAESLGFDGAQLIDAATSTETVKLSMDAPRVQSKRRCSGCRPTFFGESSFGGKTGSIFSNVPFAVV